MSRVPPTELLASESWDVVIAGAGMGGAVLAHGLARRGLRTLVLERGRDLVRDRDVFRGDHAELHPRFDVSTSEALRAAGREDRAIGWNGADVIPEVGAGAGGSSALFGGVLERFFPEDFEPRRHYDAGASALPDAWPISYRELVPHYAEAEALFEVCGGPDPLRDGDARPASEWPGPASAAVGEALTRRALHPYPVRRGRTRAGCAGCQGYLCATECKRDAGSVALARAFAAGAGTVFECAVERVDADRRRVRHLEVSHAGGGARVRARVFVLALGALRTPALLLASRGPEWPAGVANGSGAVGRHLMRHGIDIWALRGAPPAASADDAKALAFTDFYARGREKLGAVQSFGVPPPLAYLRRQALVPLHWRLGPLSRWLWRRYARTPLLASILEDFPYAENRVTVATDGRPQVTYRQRESELHRRRTLQELLRAAFRGLGATLVSDRDAPKALGHVCGTCRFGDDPATSVLDRDNRAHELDNLYVADASFFPSSGGLNPALTIAANALRVADRIAERL